ncbi:unnamed protein product [Arabis nemorensis]|uniref:Uncharacterized protein n=1 Tax=Arabis nemorensis TaxID=586526 RepID=A0A565CQN2_9BRAS|nr:unnamed protein product [Arabis nemorensis]
MSLLLSRLRLGKPALVRRSYLHHLSNVFSSSSLLQTPPCSIIGVTACGEQQGRLIIGNANESGTRELDKKVPMVLVYSDIYHDVLVTIGSSNGWVATQTVDDRIFRQNLPLT